MADYENRGDNINNEEKNARLDEENKQDEMTPPENTGGAAEEHTQQTASGNDNRSENRYAEFREIKTEYEPPKKKKKKSEVHMTKGAVAMLIVLCLMVSVLAGVGMNALTGGGQDPSAVSTTGGTVQSGGGTTNSGVIPGQNTSNGNSETAPSIETQPRENTEYSALAKVANECIKSVVIINITETSTAYGQEYTTSGAGSGVIYTTDGYIITNYHVVGKDTSTISVTLYNGEVYEGKYIYGDEYADISVIKIEKNDCTPAKIGDSTKMMLGDTVLAIGNPLGYGLSVTDGIVSALARDVTVENTTMTLMQTSAAINSGNSGGGLFNTDGELIGIVNAKIGGTSVEGMGFAIPSSTVVKCNNDLKNYGYITGQARLGVTVQTKQYQTWPYMQTYSYIQVTEINANGSAAKSGLKVGDILQKINGTEISSFATLSQMLTKYEVGDTVALTIQRPTIELTSSNLSEYLNTCEEIDITITFVEFNPNA